MGRGGGGRGGGSRGGYRARGGYSSGRKVGGAIGDGVKRVRWPRFFGRGRYEEKDNKTPEELQTEADESAARWLAFGSRVGRVLKSVSAVGEATASVVKSALAPKVLAASHAVTLAYIAYDVTVVTTAAPAGLQVRQGMQQSLFQLTSSIVAPALALRFAMPRFVALFSTFGRRMRKLGPLALGLATICTFPILIDVPSKFMSESVFQSVWPVQVEEKKDTKTVDSKI